jgi:hypothetical protein
MNFIKVRKGSDDMLINLDRVELITITHSDDEEKDEKEYIRFAYNDGFTSIHYSDDTWEFLLQYIGKAQKGMTIPKPLDVKVVNK